MDVVMSKGKGKKGNLIVKTWDRCKSFGRKGSSSSSGNGNLQHSGGLSRKSKSWSSMDHAYLQLQEEDEKRMKKKKRVAPEGCFSVYVGPQRQRFVIKTEYANHPLFKILLEEAESEYGFNSEGPLVLPCNVDLLCKVLLAMDDSADNNIRRGCSFPKGYRLLTPPRMIAINHF